MRGVVPPSRFGRAAVPFVLVLVLVLGAASACRGTREAPPREELERGRQELLHRRTTQVAASSSARSVQGVPGSARVDSSSPIASALIEIRARATSLAVPPPLPRHIALGKGFVVQLGASETVVRDTREGNEIVRMPLKAPRAAVALPAGSVLVAALDASYRFDPGQKRAHVVTRLSLLPGFVLEPRRGSQEQLWVLQAPLKSLQSYSLNSDAGLGLESERVLARYDGGAFTTLSDGSFLYSEEGALAHGFGSGGPKSFRLPAGIGRVWRLAAAARLDRAWVVTRSGELLLVELGARLRIVRSVHTGLEPFDFAASANRLALVSVSERAGEPRRFSLTVYSAEGAQLFSLPLSVDEVTPDADWAARVAANKEVVLGDHPPRVAVGGPASLRVFELDSGKQLFAH